MNGAEQVAQELRDAGVDVVFGLPGAHNLALWPACEAAGVRIVGMRTEQACAFAADGYARATGRVGVALVTTGPGAANTVGAVGEAWASRSPVVVIATDIPRSLRRPGAYRGVLHECTDQAALFASVVKQHTDEVSIGLASATATPARPVYVGIPTDALVGDAGARHELPSWKAESVQLAPVFEALRRSERPLLWAGGGAREAGDAVGVLARCLGAPVVTTYQARGILAPDHPLLVPAPPHEPLVTALIARSDLAIVIGSDLDQMNTMQWRLPLPARRIAVNVDADDAVKNYTMDAVIDADARAVATIAEGVAPRVPWAGDLRELGRAIRQQLDPDARTFLEHTERALPPDTVVFADMCIAGYWLAGHLQVGTHRGLHYPMGWGTLGFALPAAIGASVARRTAVFVGDGGALFGIGELSALATLGTNCTIVVVDDGGYGMLRYGPHPSTTGNDLPPVDFVQVAHAFGIPATRVDGFGADYAQALANRGPQLVHVHASLHPPVTTTPFWPMQQ